VKIGEVSKLTGVSQRMIRHFESMNLLSPDRVGSYRHYTDANKNLILKIKRLQEQGLSLKEIRTVLESPDENLEVQLLESLSRNRKQIKDLEAKNLLIWETLQSLKLNSSAELLVKEGVIMEFVKSFEEKNIIRGRMPYLEVLYETFVHLSGNHWSMKWDQLPMKVLHSTDLVQVNEGIDQRNSKDLKVVVSSEEQQFRNAFVFFLSPELLKSLTGKEINIQELESDKDTNLIITKWLNSVIETFNHAWNASFTTIRLENHGMLKSDEDIQELYHEDEIFILTNMYTEGEKERFSVALPYRFVSIVYNLLKR
jgi:DNA-binding transcriptional MerR regulator